MKITQLLAAVGLLSVSPASAQVLTAELFATGFSKPTHVLEDPAQPGWVFVVERSFGVQLLIDGVRQSPAFLDISDEVGPGTQGIMGMALHPDYASNGRFFLVYTDENQISHVAEYARSANPALADPASRIQILGPEPQPGPVHNWNLPLFGPDGMLYVSTGDGVLSSDQVFNNSQDLGSIFGKVLRLNVDLPAPYIPVDNPYVGQPGVREEVWLYGVRQPWRFDFDPLTQDFWLADVGNNSDEEVNVLPAGTAAGANLGWECLVGREKCLNAVGCLACGDPSYEPADWAYQQTEGRCSIIGGVVYRGSEIPWLQGKYLYADYCSGEFWSVRHDGGRIYDWVQHDLGVSGPGLELPVSFGRLANGEVLVCDQAGNEIWKLVAGSDCGSYGGLLACTATENSTGYSAVLGAGGSLVLADNDLHLYVGNVPRDEFGYMLMGQNSGFIPLFGGSQGNLCLGAPIVRFPNDVLTADPGNYTVVFQPDLTNLPAGTLFQPGDTWIFQYWFRDTNPGSTSNTSDAIAVTFCS